MTELLTCLAFPLAQIVPHPSSVTVSIRMGAGGVLGWLFRADRKTKGE